MGIVYRLTIQRCSMRSPPSPTFVSVSIALQVRLGKSAGNPHGLNLASLSDREKDDILDLPIVPDRVFGSAFTSM